MKKILSILLLTLSIPVLAQSHLSKNILDKISFQISAKQWINTSSALLSVGINMTLNNADLVKARTDILDRLNKIAKAQWHLLEFNRSQDSSGLEKLFVNAQARIEQSALTDIYNNAKSVSVPGAQYQIISIEFKPSLEETQAIRAKVREELYHQAFEELARINKIYPNQHYSINQLNFIEGENVVAPQRAYQTKDVNALSLDGIQTSLNVSNELMLTAIVDVASNRKEEV